jgi:hypothetical protein
MAYAAPPYAPHEQKLYRSSVVPELFFGLEWLALHASPIYWGWTLPRGDGSAVIVVPGFTGIDLYLTELYLWVKRIGYRPYFSGIGFVATCPNELAMRLEATIDRAYRESGRRVHLIGHSFGGILSRVVAAMAPEHIASVTSLGSPLRGRVVHRAIHSATQLVRGITHALRPELPELCGDTHCGCAFVRSLSRPMSKEVRQTVVCSTGDRMVYWPTCLTGKEDVDFVIDGATHLGMVANPIVYEIIGKRLANVPVMSGLDVVDGR